MFRPRAIGYVFAAMMVTIPGLVFAACPTSLSDGIQMTREAPYFDVRLTPLGGPAIREERAMERNGARETVVTTYAHALAPLVRKSASSELRLDYDGDVDGLAQLDRRGTWSSDFVLFVNGDRKAPGQLRARFLDKGAVDVGVCRYDAWRVVVTTAIDGSAPSEHEHLFVPALGASVRTTALDASGNPRSAVVFDRIDVLQ